MFTCTFEDFMNDILAKKQEEQNDGSIQLENMKKYKSQLEKIKLECQQREKEIDDELHKLTTSIQILNDKINNPLIGFREFCLQKEILYGIDEASLWSAFVDLYSELSKSKHVCLSLFQSTPTSWTLLVESQGNTTPLPKELSDKMKKIQILFKKLNI